MLEKILNHKLELAFAAIGLASIILSALLLKNKIPNNGFYIKLYGFILSSFAIGITVFYSEKKSSDTSNEIKESTAKTYETAKTTENKVDTANDGIEILREKNENLKSQITELDTTLSEKNKTILDLTNQTIDLSIRLSEKAKSIYDINKAIKFSMPNSISVSYNVFFQLTEPYQKKADSIINKHHQFDNPGAYSSIEYQLIKGLFDWNAYFSDWISVAFTKDYKISKTGIIFTPLLSFSNVESIRNSNNNFQGLKKELLYNPTEKKFLIQIEGAQLLKQISSNLSLNPNLINTSIFDLAKSTMIFNQAFPDRFKSIKITHLKISSQELNLDFLELKNSEGSVAFIGDVKFYEEKK